MRKKELPVIELEVDSKPMQFNWRYSICGNPSCDCNIVSIGLVNEKQSVGFHVDLKKETYVEGDFTEEQLKIIKAFVALIKSSINDSFNFSFFKEVYGSVKEQARIRKDTIDSFRLGVLMDYSDILGSENYEMEVGNKDYVVFDAYCVMPDCDCADVALTFIERVYKAGVREPDFSFLYNYLSGDFKEVIGISGELVQELVSGFSGKTRNSFKRRHKELKKDVRQDILKKIKKEGFVKRVFKKRKLGRNYPCHCGSGKKYKKCCLNGDIKKYGRPMRV